MITTNRNDLMTPSLKYDIHFENILSFRLFASFPALFLENKEDLQLIKDKPQRYKDNIHVKTPEFLSSFLSFGKSLRVYFQNNFSMI